MMHEIQLKIIKNLTFTKSAKFSELKKDSENIDNNQFCFHINRLLSNGLIQKDDNSLYSLTHEGIAMSEKIDTDKVSIMQSAKITVYLGAINDKRQVLIYTRKKHPFFDCQGFGGGRVSYGENIVDAAKRELREETGLEGNPELIKILHNKLYDKTTGEIAVDKILFFFKFTNPTGELKCSDEGFYEWVDINKVKKYIQKPFDSKEEFLKQVDYLVNWDGKIALEEKDEITENY